jgi:hypothetical protein
MKIAWSFVCVVSVVLLGCRADLSAQGVSQRGFVEGAVWMFPQAVPRDPTRIVGDLLVRDDVLYKAAGWLQFVTGVDFRANSHHQVADEWRVDISDHESRRPRLSVRRLSATLTRGRLTVEAGRQFIRWGKTDIVAPTDRFAPRDFVNVVDATFLAVQAVRAVAQVGGDNAIEAVWTPRFTPSRTPLLDERWTVVPPAAAAIPLVDAGAIFPTGSQTGIRWSHIGQALEYSGAYFDGFDHLPTLQSELRQVPLAVDITRLYPSIRMYGVDAAIPNRWFTVKGETAYVSASSSMADEYLLYVLQVERQRGEWLLVVGYAGELTTRAGASPAFAPDRGLSRAVIGRASYTIDPNRTLVIEGAARRNGRGLYAKAEYSQARGAHWRVTVALRAIGGRDDDFLGQYRRNSHATVTTRYSF